MSIVNGLGHLRAWRSRMQSTGCHTQLLEKGSMNKSITKGTMMKAIWVTCLLRIAPIGPVVLLGCGELGGNDTSAAKEPVSWESFKSSVTRDVDGRTIYVVEWDQAVTEPELRQRYDAYVARMQDIRSGHGESEQPSIVNQVGGVDDIWHNQQQLSLTYCVSNAFGASKGRVVTEMAQAAAAWEQVARVDYTYVSSQDANCSNTNPNVMFSVAPWNSGGACAFFPSGGGCVARTLVINLADLDTNYGSIAPNVRTVGVFRHELGHILGLRHEHTRPDSGTCFENSSWRTLTPYDRSSVMHYPWCNGVFTSDLSITSADAQGASLLYAPATTSCGEASCVAPQGDHVSHYTGADCTGTESYYTPYFTGGTTGVPGNCQPNLATGAACGTQLRTVTNISVRANGSCTNSWPSGNTLSGFVTVYRSKCGEASCVSPQGDHVSHFTGPSCTGTESYYTPYFTGGTTGVSGNCQPNLATGAVCGKALRTVTNVSARVNGACNDYWPGGNTLSGFVTVYR